MEDEQDDQELQHYDNGPKQSGAKAESKPAPVLPWMQVSALHTHRHLLYLMPIICFEFHDVINAVWISPAQCSHQHLHLRPTAAGARHL
jgi:hypothetical protein